jgi:hypothetical protein
MSISPISSNSLLNSADVSGSITAVKPSTTITKVVSSSSAVAASTPSALLAKDMNLLRWDMSSGNTPAAKADVNRVKADLLAEAASVPSSNTLGSPLDISVYSISNSLSDGSVQGDPNQATYQSTKGPLSGDLINTSA